VHYQPIWQNFQLPAWDGQSFWGSVLLVFRKSECPGKWRMLLVALSASPTTQSDAQPRKFWRGLEFDCVCQSFDALSSEVQNKMIIMGHQISSCHVPVVRSFFIL
jgi:hypothetical protein